MVDQTFEVLADTYDLRVDGYRVFTVNIGHHRLQRPTLINPTVTTAHTPTGYETQLPGQYLSPRPAAR